MTAPLDEKAEHPRIWLEPAGAPDRCWCSDNQWGEEGVEYILASEALSAVALPDELEGRLIAFAGITPDHPSGGSFLNDSARALVSEAHSIIAALRAERDRWSDSYKIAIDQAMENGRAGKTAEAERDAWMKAVADIAASVALPDTIKATGSTKDMIAYFADLRRRAETAEAEVKRLTEENEALIHDISRYVNANADLLARIKALEEALEPVAALVKSHDDAGVAYLRSTQGKEAAKLTYDELAELFAPAKEAPLTDGAMRNPVRLTWGDLRAARKAMEGGE